MATVQEANSESSYHRSGRYQFRYWHFDDQGQRFALSHAPKGRASAIPDLINTAYRNAGGSKTIYGIAFDLDAHRAAPRWLDGGGCLDWPSILDELTKKHPHIAHQVSHAVRSTGGKGIALVLAINPLPIIASTSSNQRAAQNLQSRLINLFVAMGLGADPGARGLERDYPNFQNADRLLYENRLALRRAEQGREAIITRLHAYLNELARQERRDTRIYPDARAETGLAKLVEWLLGCYDPGLGLRVPSYLSGSEVWASTKTLATVTGLSSKFLIKFLQHPPAWLEVDYAKGEGWRLRIPLGRAVQRLLPRAEMLLASAAAGTAPHKPLFSIGVIKEPHLVGDDERNAWLTSMALAYKWHGFSCEEALAKIQLRLQVMPDYECSRNCRQVRSIVRAIFKNVPETAGRFASRQLPPWMTDDHNFAGIGKRTSPRRGFAPEEELFGWGEGVSGLMSQPKLVANPGSSDRGARSGEIVVGLFDQGFQSPAEQSAGISRITLAAAGGVSLVAVRWRQRVGIFDGDDLILCVTKRHYRASAAIALLKTRSEYAETNLRVYTPHLKRQAQYRPAIEACQHVLAADVALGGKKTYAVKIMEWTASKGAKESVEESTVIALDPPF